VPTTIKDATRCDRCERLAYGVQVLELGRLCRRCVDELHELEKAFMQGRTRSVRF
jgi:hypothetical protein